VFRKISGQVILLGLNSRKLPLNGCSVTVVDMNEDAREMHAILLKSATKRWLDGLRGIACPESSGENN
jgi:hypothetical protein